MLLRSVPRPLFGLWLCLMVLLTGCASADTETGSGAVTSAPASAPASVPASAQASAPVPGWAAGRDTVAEAGLPAEARRTLALIDVGGPFPYAEDGGVFGNRERELPRRERGHYHEYTVRTPGERDRGARRIVTGRDGEVYYTDDHYNSFRAVLR
ncbi:ribonuclease T1 [Streptomyces sp. V3I8]|uniref:ribonuclease domain-containing protein n=1 Tax=Streptomyces sp. V3I8 TaxID=3042279 RepID=UPI00278A23E4|nr:ribonuclease domain-containing protein [Streptomyces sp. V3I8]MDQ1040002.1 ribonuclease T1 [Streptomyces sp. V3I8]